MINEQLVCRYENNDEPTCPKCGGYNAMLTDFESNFAWNRTPATKDGVHPGGSVRPDFRKCRDCGTQAIVVSN